MRDLFLYEWLKHCIPVGSLFVIDLGEGEAMNFEFDDLVDVYTLVVVVSAITVTVVGLRVLKRIEGKRLKFARNTEFTEAVDTESPEDDLEKLNRHRAVQSIESRFMFIRRSFVPVMILVAFVLIAIPLLPTLPATYLTLAASILAVVAGVAAKPVVENFIAGMVITFTQPIRINDTVILDGHYGTVEKINMLYSVIKIWNWRRYMIPNHKLIQREIQNLSHSGENEWAHVAFWVSPDAEMEKVKALAKKAMKQSRVLQPVEPPSFWIIDMEKDSIQCWVAGWVQNAAEAWTLRSTTRKYLIKYLQEEGIAFHMNHGNFQLQDKRGPLEH